MNFRGDIKKCNKTINKWQKKLKQQQKTLISQCSFSTSSEQTRYREANHRYSSVTDRSVKSVTFRPSRQTDQPTDVRRGQPTNQGTLKGGIIEKLHFEQLPIYVDCSFSEFYCKKKTSYV